MTPPDLKESNLFHEALARPADEREAFVRDRCRADSKLLNSVLELVRAHERDPNFLDNFEFCELEPQLPGLVGPYVPVSELGRGGMGIVYLAQQDGPIRRQVALKLIRPELQVRRVVSRFEKERQTLAKLNHPNIATVLDAGTTDAGIPYFVMEYVDGVPIDRYCDDAKATIQQRVELIVQLLAGVQHAHARGVVHRDLKPSNILVCLVDGTPTVKIIDFGVAKALQLDSGSNASETLPGTLVGTPRYMSPEQISMRRIDHRTDLYAIGAVLYELLVGKPPFELAETSATVPEELYRRVCHETPEPPSFSFSAHGDSGRIADLRSTTVPDLRRTMRRSLDRVVLRALEKKPDHRYDSADQMVSDLKRFLSGRATRPLQWSVSARRLSTHSKWIAGALAVVLVLLLRPGVAWLQDAFAQTARPESAALDECRPSRYRFEGPRLFALAQSGAECWVRELVGIDHDYVRPQQIDLFVRAVDTGPYQKTLVAYPPRDQANSPRFILLDHHGRSIWSREMAPQLHENRTPIVPVYSPKIVDFVPDDPPYAIVQLEHSFRYPYVLAMLDLETGSVLGSYRHPGRPTTVLRDVDGDGDVELVLSGVNNPGPGLGHAFLSILDLPLAPPEGLDFFGLDGPRERIYILFPRPLVYDAYEVAPSVTKLESAPDGSWIVTVDVGRHSLREGLGGLPVVYHLDTNFVVQRHFVADITKSAHSAKFDQGEITHRLTDEEIESWKKVRYFDRAPDGNSAEVEEWFFEATGGFAK